MSSHRYYIIFIDDYSHTSWIKLLKDHSHILDVINFFFSEITNQFSITPKCLCNDNALEFVQSGFNHIVHLQELSIKLLVLILLNKMVWLNVNTDTFWTSPVPLCCRVPKFLWSNAILTASYLINGIPSTPLGDEIPLRYLRLRTEIFSLPPKVVLLWLCCFCSGFVFWS